MKDNIILIISLLFFSWILLITFSSLIVYFISSFQDNGFISNLLHVLIGVVLLITWLGIWYLVTRTIFLRNIKKINRPNTS